jgi:hypothetical protein
VHERIPAGDRIVEIGAGRGADATYLVGQGHPVIATDFAGSALAHLRSLTQEPGGAFSNGALEVRDFKLGDLRHDMWLGAKLARQPHHLYAHQLLGALTPKSWECLWIVASMALRGKSKLFLEFSVSGRLPSSRVFRRNMMRRLDADRICADIAAHGGTVEHRSIEHGTDAWGGPDPAVCRLIVSWRRQQPEGTHA